MALCCRRLYSVGGWQQCAKPYTRVYFTLFIFKVAQTGTTNLLANGCNIVSYLTLQSYIDLVWQVVQREEGYLNLCVGWFSHYYWKFNCWEF